MRSIARGEIVEHAAHPHTPSARKRIREPATGPPPISMTRIFPWPPPVLRDHRRARRAGDSSNQERHLLPWSCRRRFSACCFRGIFLASISFQLQRWEERSAGAVSPARRLIHCPFRQRWALASHSARSSPSPSSPPSRAAPPALPPACRQGRCARPVGWGPGGSRRSTRTPRRAGRVIPEKRKSPASTLQAPAAGLVYSHHPCCSLTAGWIQITVDRRSPAPCAWAGKRGIHYVRITGWDRGPSPRHRQIPSPCSQDCSLCRRQGFRRRRGRPRSSASTEPYDAVIIDLGLPRDRRGPAVLNAWRRAERGPCPSSTQPLRPLERTWCRALSRAPMTLCHQSLFTWNELGLGREPLCAALLRRPPGHAHFRDCLRPRRPSIHAPGVCSHECRSS